jgi:hypothetical protein
MARQFKSTDTSKWNERFGTGKDGSLTVATDSVFKINNSPFTTNANAYGTFTGTSGNTSGSVSDGYGFWTSYVTVGDYVLIHQSYGTGAGNWELNVVTGGIPSSGGSSTLTFKYPLQNTYVGGCQIIKVPQFTDVTINNGVTLYPLEYNRSYAGIMAFFCNGTTTITGNINANARGYQGGTTTGGDGNQGDSSIGYGSASTSANGSGGGGGGIGNGASAGSGGGGGNGTAGANGTAGSRIAGVGGSIDGDTALTDFNLGGGGGGGGFRTGQSGGPGNGGYGAAGIFIFTKNLVVTGSIVASGQTGSVKSGSGSHGCGGGGAGGSVLFKTITATLGSNLVQANGGAGGFFDSNNNGGTGGSGRIHLDYAGTYSGTTTPTIDVTQDSSLYPSGGSFLYNLI